MNNTKKKILSLFSGCGGMDLGFEGNFEVFKSCINSEIYPEWKTSNNNWIKLPKSNYETVFANDILKTANVAWCNYFSKLGYNDAIFRSESIVDLVKAYYKGGFNFPQNVDVVTGGFPCQDFSVAGKRKGFNSHKNHKGEIVDFEDAKDSRGLLYLWMKEVIKITKPKVFIAENVKGLVSLGNVKEIIEADFSDIDEQGYLVLPARVLHSAEYGVPQKRERVFFIGFNKKHLNNKALNELTKTVISSDYDPYPSVTHYKPFNENIAQLRLQANNLKPFVTTKEILGDLLEPELTADLSQRYYSKAKWCGNSQGQTEIDLNGVAPTIRAEHHGNIEYRRLSKEHGGKHIEELEAGLQERRLTIRECARIQTFPNDYEFVIQGEGSKKFTLSPSASYKLIGNAVPPLLAYHIGQRLERIWDKLFITEAIEREEKVLANV